MSDNIVFLLKKDAKKAGVTSPVTVRVPVHRAEIDLQPVLAGLLLSKIPAAIVLETGTREDGECAVWRKPMKKRLRPSWDFADQGNGPAPVIGKRRNAQINFNHARWRSPTSTNGLYRTTNQL